MDHKRHRWISVGAVISTLAIAFKMTFFMPIFLYFHGVVVETPIFDSILFYYINTYRIFYALQFVLACFAIRKRFSALNSLNVTSAIDGVKLVATKNVLNRKFRKTYMKLCDGIDIISETFSVHLLAIFLIYLVRTQSIFDRMLIA